MKRLMLMLAAGCLMMGMVGCIQDLPEQQIVCEEPPPPAPKCGPKGDVTAEGGVPCADCCDVIRIKKHGPAEVIQGAEFTYTILVQNVSKMDIRDVKVMEELPQNFALKGTNPKAKIAGKTLIWDLGNMPAGSSQTLKVVGSATATGELVGCTEADWKPPLVCMAIKAINPQVKVTKEGPAQVVLCDTINYKIVVENTGNGAACDVTVTDVLPDGLKGLDGKTKYVWSVPRLDPGQKQAFAIQAKADKVGSYTNSATAAIGGQGEAKSNPVTTKVVQPQLAVTKTAPKTRFINRPIDYTITVKNTGAVDATNVVLTDSISGAAIQSASDNGAVSGSGVTWNLGTLKPGASKAVKVVAVASAAGMVNNTASATAYCADAQAQAQVEIKGIPAILLEVIDIDDPIEVGAMETYEIRVTNQGSAVDGDIQVVATLPKEQQYVSSSGPSGAGKAAGQVITFPVLKSLDPKAVAVYKVQVKATGEGDVRFKVSLTSQMLTSPVQETESTHLYK